MTIDPLGAGPLDSHLGDGIDIGGHVTAPPIVNHAAAQDGELAASGNTEERVTTHGPSGPGPLDKHFAGRALPIRDPSVVAVDVRAVCNTKLAFAVISNHQRAC